MRVRVAEERCQGHTRCHAIAPDVFEPREEDGHSVVVSPNVPPELEKKVRRAVRACPEQAIIVDGASEVEEDHT